MRVATPYVRVLFSSLLLFSCKDNAVDVPTSPTSPFTLMPTSGLIGSELKIIGRGFYPGGTSVKFTGAQYWEYVSDDSTISVVVPFGAQTGPLTVLTKYGEEQTLSFEVTEVYDPTKLATTWWNLPPPASWLDSCSSDFMGYVSCWDRYISGDTVTLIYPEFRLTTVYYLTQVLKFKDQGPGNLPHVISFVVVHNSNVEPRTDTLKAGLVKVIEWSLDGRIKGQIFPPHYDISGYTVTFFQNG